MLTILKLNYGDFNTNTHKVYDKERVYDKTEQAWGQFVTQKV